MSNPVPRGWALQPLSALANYYNGRAFKPEEWSSEGLPIIRIAQINNRNADLDYYAGNDVSEKNYIRSGDLLFSWSATLTSLLWNRGDAVLNQHIFKVEEKDGIDRLFLHQLILSSIEPLAELSHGSTMKHIKKGVLDEYCVGTPPLPEQQKIAAILSTVDDVIEKTRAQIDKLKDLKTGMMQELLTKGIAHTEFKPLPKWRVGRIAELSEIPASWELVDINSIAKLESGHTPSRDKVEYWGGDIQWLSLHDTKNLTNPILLATVLAVTQDGIDNSSARVLPKGTVALSRTASVGNCVMLGQDMATSQDFANYVCGDKLHPKYLLQLFRWMQHVWSNLSEGSTHKTIYMPVFKKLQILLPPYEEQVRIADSADTVDADIVAKSQKLAALSQLKKALMQDLLTGKVRVTIDDKESAVA